MISFLESLFSYKDVLHLYNLNPLKSREIALYWMSFNAFAIMGNIKVENTSNLLNKGILVIDIPRECKASIVFFNSSEKFDIK